MMLAPYCVHCMLICISIGSIVLFKVLKRHTCMVHACVHSNERAKNQRYCKSGMMSDVNEFNRTACRMLEGNSIGYMKTKKEVLDKDLKRLLLVDLGPGKSISVEMCLVRMDFTSPRPKVGHDVIRSKGTDYFMGESD